jgi:hypothetical protein
LSDCFLLTGSDFKILKLQSKYKKKGKNPKTQKRDFKINCPLLHPVRNSL